MFHRAVQFPKLRWFKIFPVLAIVGTQFFACGVVTRSKNDGLSLKLELPEGESDSTFWYGVAQKTLLVHHGDDPATKVAWQEGQTPSVGIVEGDSLEFQGSDDKGNVVVEGQVTAGAEKSLTIPVHRVL